MKTELAKLGDRVKCEVTGLEGIVTTVSQNLYGCDRLIVQPRAEAGKIPDSVWIDITAAQVLERGVIKGHTSADRNQLGGPSLSIQTPKKMP